MKVTQIARNLSNEGWAMSDFMEAYPHLSSEQVEAALHYIADHPQEIEEHLDCEDAMIAEIARGTPHPLTRSFCATF